MHIVQCIKTEDAIIAPKPYSPSGWNRLQPQIDPLQYRGTFYLDGQLRLALE